VDERVNLLNVAVSRARDHLLVIGDEATLRAGRNTRLLVSAAARTEGFASL
jgi:superfamily I DNA and/or RNA helicase